MKPQNNLVLVLCCLATLSCFGQSPASIADLRLNKQVRLRQPIDNQEVARLELFLEARQIEPNIDGVQSFLRQMSLSQNDQAQVERLMAQLGAGDFQQRKSAQVALLKLPVVPTELLMEMARSSDIEESFRAKAILRFAGPLQVKTLRNSLRWIALKNATHLTEDVLKVAEKFRDNPAVIGAAKSTILAIVTPQEIPLLVSRMTINHPPTVQEIAIFSLRMLATDSLSDQFCKWAQNQRLADVTRVESALSMADLGDRRALNLIWSLMRQAESAPLRSRCQVALRRLTGQQIQYSAFARLDIRTRQLENWKNWIEANGANASLSFPLNAESSQSLVGYTLIAISNQDKVVLFDETMNETWTYKVGYPTNAEKMPNGNILITSYRQREVLEVNLEKEVVRRMRLKYPQDARPLANGNWLVSCHMTKKLMEVAPAGNTVFEYKTDRRWIEQAVRLPNGNTLIAETTQQKPVIAEITSTGNRVWEYIVPSVNSLDSIQALDNGNVLITVIGSAFEVDKKDDQIVWRIDRENLRDAYRIPDGNTLILAGDKVMELDIEGKELWSKGGMSYGTVRR